jgi:hypothetical protein
VGTPSIRRVGACYIYGSVHVEIPRVDLLEKLVGRVSYVLLEGVRSSGLWRLVRRYPSLAPGILLLRATLWFIGLRVRLEGWRRGVEFAGDMEYVASFFRRRDPQVRVEVVDASLGELVEVSKRVFLVLTVLATVMAVALAFLLAYPVRLVLLILNTAQSGLLLGADGIRSFQASALALPLALAAYVIALYKLSSIRDRKLIDRAVELVSGGHDVLIVRGGMHVKHIVEELRRRGVACEILNSK